MKQPVFVVSVLLFFCILPLTFGGTPYQLQSRDIVEISVYGEPDLKTISRISDGGEITFPLLRSITIAGLTLEEAEHRIEKKLQGGDFLTNPQVTIYVKKYSTIKIYVYGSVRKPGSYEFSQETATILKAIAMAGGLTEKAYETDIRIIRREHEKKRYRTFTVNMINLMLGVKGIFDIPLESGDIVSVPQAPPIYIFGEVDKEGIVNYKKDMRILQAVTMAGGFTEKANSKKVMVLRLNPATRTLDIINVNFELIIHKGDRTKNILIEPYDIIITPESWL